MDHLRDNVMQQHTRTPFPTIPGSNYSLGQWNWFSDVTGCTWIACSNDVKNQFHCTRLYSLVQWNWFSVVTGCTWVACISDVREPISLHQAVYVNIQVNWPGGPLYWLSGEYRDRWSILPDQDVPDVHLFIISTNVEWTASQMHRHSRGTHRHLFFFFKIRSWMWRRNWKVRSYCFS